MIIASILAVAVITLIGMAVAARKAAEADYGFHPNHGRLS